MDFDGETVYLTPSVCVFYGQRPETAVFYWGLVLNLTTSCVDHVIDCSNWPSLGVDDWVFICVGPDNRYEYIDYRRVPISRFKLVGAEGHLNLRVFIYSGFEFADTPLAIQSTTIKDLKYCPDFTEEHLGPIVTIKAGQDLLQFNRTGEGRVRDKCFVDFRTGFIDSPSYSNIIIDVSDVSLRLYKGLADNYMTTVIFVGFGPNVPKENIRIAVTGRKRPGVDRLLPIFVRVFDAACPLFIDALEKPTLSRQLNDLFWQNCLFADQGASRVSWGNFSVHRDGTCAESGLEPNQWAIDLLSSQGLLYGSYYGSSLGFVAPPCPFEGHFPSQLMCYPFSPVPVRGPASDLIALPQNVTGDEIMVEVCDGPLPPQPGQESSLDPSTETQSVSKTSL